MEEAVKKAGQEWNSTYADKLEKLLAKRAITVNLGFSTKNLNNLDDVKRRLAELKIEPLTPENKTAIKDLVRELKELAKAMEKVQKYSKIQTPELQQALANKANAEAAHMAEKYRQANERLEVSKRRVALAEQKHAEALSNTSKKINEQHSYVSRLIKRMAVYASFSYMGQFLTNVREVTAQFELQRVSLGAIIQDQNRANQLFSEIKSFALKSPVSILDLTKYTKQLAAYKVGVDELFETTKKLTDVSVGLGVSMDRVVLAYGQTRATGYLRASEIRQFTEMGVPIVEELAAKLSKMNGELVTAAQVMDMVSKRGISFELVKEVFDDMTSAGGMFYNMQEKQGNTLFGLWAKLGDAASVMYDQIGNTESVSSGMKTAIGLLTELMRNWKALANTAAFVVAPSAIFGMFTKYALSSTRKQAADAAATAATKAREAAVLQLNRAIEKGSVDDINAAYATLQKAKADEAAAQKAATKTGLLASGFKSIASSMAMGLGIGVVVTAITTLAYKLFEAHENANRLKNKLKEIDAERIVVTEQSVRNFEYLADAAIKAADGSKEQKDKLEELHRTFQGMIPVENMSIENLQRLRSGADSAAEGYKSLTESIRNYIAQQQKQKALGAIEEEFGAKRINAMKSLYDWFDKQGLGVEERTRFFAEFEKQAQDTSKTLKEQIVSAFNEAGIEGGEKLANSIAKEKGFWNKTLDWLGQTQPLMFGSTAVAYNAIFPEDGFINDLANATRKYNEEVSGTLSYYEKLEGKIGKYTKALDEAKRHMSDFIPAGLKENTFAYQQQVDAEQIRTWGKVIVDALKAENIKIENEWFNIDKDKAFDITDIASININAIKDALGAGHGDIKNLLDKIAESYNEIIPKDAVVRSVRSKFEELANSMGLIDKVKGNLMGTTEGLEDYRKKINDTAKDYAKQVENLTKVLAATPVISLDYKKIADKLESAKDLEEFYSKMAEILGKSVSGSGRTSDSRLQNLKEEISLTKKLYDEYHKLEKQIGATKAAEKIQEIYSNTIKTLQGRAGKYGFEFELPFTDENLKSNMQHFIDKMKELQKLRDKKGKPLFPNIGKEIDEAVAQLEDVDLNSLQKALEKKLKMLADRISRTKTAKEFYEKILRLTRNEDLAFRATFSVFGQDKLDTFTDEVEQLKQNFGEVDITAAINLNTKQIDYKALREIWEADKALPDNLRKIPQAYDSAIKSILDAGDKLSERQFERWGKDLERARDYADKRIELAEYTATQIAEIEAKRDSLKPDSEGYEQQRAMYDEMIRGYREREKNEAAKLDYEQIKEQIGMFDDLGVRIGTAFEDILNGLREYAKSPDFARLGLEAQKNVYQQIAKIEDRMAEGFQGIGIGMVSEYVRQYSTAASEYLTAQNNLREATLKAIEADKEWERVKNSNDEAAKSAALAEKTLADSRVRTAAASVNAAGANLQRAQEGAARASAKFDSNLQKVESSLKSLNGGALKALWDLIGDKGKRSVGEFLSGSRKILSALDKLTKALAESGSDMGQLSTTIATNLATALQNINPEDTEAITKAATESLKTTLSSVISDKGVVELLANTLSKNIGEIASQALSGVLSTEDAANKVGALIDGVADAASKTGEMWGAIISLVLSLLDEFAENGIGTFLGELLDNIADAIEGILANLLTDSLPKILGSVGNVVKGVGTGLADMLTFGAFDLTGAKRIKKANKEIKRQQELLEQLQYTYGRLEGASDKVFGRDYLNNYNLQLQNLTAQQTAYLKQAEAERSKGKKKDEEKIREFENQARDTADKIKELQDDLVAHFTGQSRQDAARQMAKRWIDARASMSDTFAAIKGDYQDMIKNMLVETMAAKIIENAFSQVWDDVDERLKENDVDGAVNAFMKGMDSALTSANNGMEVWWKAMEARGYDMKKLLGDTDIDSEYTGIAKNVAGATSEEINNVAAIGNTLMYYVSPIPRMDENLARVVAIMEGRGATLPAASGATAGAVDYTEMFTTANQHLSSLPRMEQHLAEIHTMLGRVIVSRGNGFVVNTALKN